MKQPCVYIFASGAPRDALHGCHVQSPKTRLRTPRGTGKGLLAQIRLQDIGLVRITRDHDRRYCAGKANRGWQPCEETCPDRSAKSRLEGPLRLAGVSPRSILPSLRANGSA